MKPVVKQVDFVTQLSLTVLMDNSFRLAADFFVSLEGELLCIPEGFETDLASVPRIPLVYLAVGGRGHKAAVLHDWLYESSMFPRLVCDQYFYHALRESGVNAIYARAMYAGVRAGGAAYYEANLNRRAAELKLSEEKRNESV